MNSINRHLVEDNNRLYNLFLENKSYKDELCKKQLRKDKKNQYASICGRIVNMSGRNCHNYFTVDKGEEDGVKMNMGVCSVDGVVGVIKTVGNHYSIIVPLVHNDLRISCRIARNRYLGIVQWGKQSIDKGELLDIPAHVDVHEGDTIVTSGLSTIYPVDIPVGEITEVKLQGGKPHYDIEIRFFTNFATLEYVYIIENKDAVEQNKIENDAE